MATKIVKLKGRVTETGILEWALPASLPPGEARITLEITPESVWSPEDLEQALRIEPLTGAEIAKRGLLGGWADQNLPEGAEWVEIQRQKRREQSGW